MNARATQSRNRRHRRVPAMLWNPALAGNPMLPGQMTDEGRRMTLQDRFVRSKHDGATLPSSDDDIAFAS